MIDDAIVEEVCRARQKMLEECGGDLGRLMEWLREKEREHPERMITREQLRKERASSKPGASSGG